ncbi:MAG: hypothetical protein PHD06_04835 [Bacteroidales bacterium]|nr:hypothetical protein [Bacteroidales bacterium]MDD4384485.1 hypothetical protein [Bacteroidales bacterium]MDY0196838.1 hypothetical protein [Tenuifilaceae bacterium]
MNNNDNILQKIEELLGENLGNFSILEHIVDVKVQFEYFEFSKAHPPIDDYVKVLEQESNLYSTDIGIDDKKLLLVGLASIDKPEAYRVIERYTQNPLPELRDWALMAFQESRMLLESKLLEEQQIFISTGLGGKEGKLRYFVVLIPMEDKPFTKLQQQLIESEFEFTLKRHHSVIESVRFTGNFATILALVPLSKNVRQPFQAAIEECNSLGPFIQLGFLITNVKELSLDEIKDVIFSAPPNVETGGIE